MKWLAIGIILAYMTASIGAQGVPLVEALGCGNCHGGIKSRPEIKDVTPLLDQAGIRYEASYLFDYLQNPRKVRPHLSVVRMPQYNFSPKEAVALVRYFKANAHPIGAELGSILFEVRKIISDQELGLGRDLIEKKCSSCHGQRKLAGALNGLKGRLEQDWVTVMLVDPELLLGHERMPALFYQKTNEPDLGYHGLIPGAINELAAVVAALYAAPEGGKGEATREQKTQKWEQAEALYPKVSAKEGRSVFLSQNCIACHRVRNEKISARNLAPNLGFEGLKVKQAWLKAYLKNPTVIHPFGFHLGTGSRMPNFNLNKSEIEEITRDLMQLKSIGVGLEEIKKPKKSTPFFNQKMLSKINHKLACLGCHELNKEGGVVGPSLSGISKRLQTNYLYQVIKDPQSIHPESVMPKPFISKKVALELLRFFTHDTSQKSKFAGPTGVPKLDFTTPFNKPKLRQGKELYETYCVFCHGKEGDGKGFNSPYLGGIKPAALKNKSYLSKRTDDTIFDAIFRGGGILSKSRLMPAWGGTLSREEIGKLSQYVRTLCQCKGPEWSLETTPEP